MLGALTLPLLFELPSAFSGLAMGLNGLASAVLLPFLVMGWA
jgi:putative effector of murein hydrolase